MAKRKRRQPESERKKSADARGPFVREFRKLYGVTLEELAKLAELSHTMLTRFEAGTRKVSADAWARLVIAMGTVEKLKRAETKARFEELRKNWHEAFFPGPDNPLAGFELPKIEAEMRRIVDVDQPRLEMSTAIAAQLPEIFAATKTRALAHIRKNPEKVLRQHLALVESRQAVEAERDGLKARVAELETNLKAYQELLPQSNRRIEELEQELARERATKGEAANG